MNKNEKIKESRKKTIERRRNQIARTYQLKIKRLSQQQSELIARTFLEAKWLYNWAIHQDNIFELDGNKAKTVQIKNQQGELEDVDR